MKNYFTWAQFGKIAVCFLFGFLFNSLADWLNSDFLKEFYQNGLLEVEFTLLGINVATTAILLKAIADLPNVKSTHFVDVRRQIGYSIYEQIVIILLTLLLVLVVSSGIISPKIVLLKSYSYHALTAILIYEAEILRDTFKGMVSIIELTMKINDESKNK